MPFKRTVVIDGKSYDVNSPTEITEDQAYQYASTQHPPAAPNPGPVQPTMGVPDSLKPPPPDQPSLLSRAAGAAIRPLPGLQGVHDFLGNVLNTTNERAQLPGFAGALNKGMAWGANALGSITGLKPEAVQGQVQSLTTPLGLGTAAIGPLMRGMGALKTPPAEPQAGFPTALSGGGPPSPPGAPPGGIMSRIGKFLEPSPQPPAYDPKAAAKLDQQFQRNIGVKYAGVAKQEAGLSKQFGQAVTAKNAAYDADEAAKAALGEQFQRGMEGRDLKFGMEQAGKTAARDRARDIVDMVNNPPEGLADSNKAFAQAKAGVANQGIADQAGVAAAPPPKPVPPPKPPPTDYMAPLTKGQATARPIPGTDATPPAADLSQEDLIQQVLAKHAAEKAAAATPAAPPPEAAGPISLADGGTPSYPPQPGNAAATAEAAGQPPAYTDPNAITAGRQLERRLRQGPPPNSVIGERQGDIPPQPPVPAAPPPPLPTPQLPPPPALASVPSSEVPPPVQPAPVAPVARRSYVGKAPIAPPAQPPPSTAVDVPVPTPEPPAILASPASDPIVANPGQAPPATPYGFMPPGYTPEQVSRLRLINSKLVESGQEPITMPEQVSELLGQPGAAEPTPAGPTVLTSPEATAAEPPRLVKRAKGAEGASQPPGEASVPQASQPLTATAGDAPGGAGPRAEPSSAPGEQTNLPPDFVVPPNTPGPRISDTLKATGANASLDPAARQEAYKLLGGLEKVSAGSPEDADLATRISEWLKQRGVKLGGGDEGGGTTASAGFNPLNPKLAKAAISSPGVRGAVGGTIGYNTTDDPRQKYVNALAGAALGAGVGPGGAIGPGSVGFGKFASNIRNQANSNLLAGSPMLSELFGDTSNILTAPVIKALQGDFPAAANTAKALINPQSWKDAGSAFKHGVMNEGNANPYMQAGSPPTMAGRWFNGMNGFTQSMIGAGGLPKAEQELLSYFSTPGTKLGKMVVKAGERPLINTIAPFLKVATNATEQGLALSPARFLSQELRDLYPAAQGSKLGNAASNIALSTPSTAGFLTGLSGHDPFSNPTARAFAGPARYGLSIGSDLHDASRYGQDDISQIGRAIGAASPLLPDIIRATEQTADIPQNVASRVLPGWTMAVGDRTVRKVGGDNSGNKVMDIIHGINDAVTNRMPDKVPFTLGQVDNPLVNRTSLPASVDYYGQPKQRGSLGHVPPPLYDTDPVANKAADLKMLNRSQPSSLPSPIDEPKAGSGAFNMRTFLARKAANVGKDENTPHLQSEWQQLRGQAVSQADHLILTDPQFASMDPDMVASLLGPLRQKLIALAEEQFRTSHPELSAYKGLDSGTTK